MLVMMRRGLVAMACVLLAALGCNSPMAEGPGGKGMPPSSSAATPATEAASVDRPGAGGAPSGATSSAEAPAGAGEGAAAGAGELDLREANITAVVYDQASGRFDVTLIHDDDGEPAYANWWQVEKLDGTLLGRRKLLHAHGTYQFTRSKDIRIPPGVELVVVRAHDPTHGYGGQAIVFNVVTGESIKVDQGSEPKDFKDFKP